MNDIASIRKMRPFDPDGSGGVATAGLAAELFAALTGLAALGTVADFAVLRVEGKNQFYQSGQADELYSISMQSPYE
jgi:hypothetical protein